MRCIGGKMLVKVLFEGIGLGAILILVCAIAIRNGAVGMIHLYHKDVQDRCVAMGLTTYDKVKKNSVIFKIICIPGYILYVVLCVYGINGTRGFLQGFWQIFVILSVMNLMDRILVDGWWVEHTKAWTIPGTEDLKPYINSHDKRVKWFSGTVGMALIAAVLAGVFSFL